MASVGTPQVSVIIPTFNSEQVLERCLRSIASQTYGNIETVVVDNHSDDQTVKIAQKYTSSVFVQGPERSAQRNFGVSKASGEYVCIVDSDMELAPRVIEACVHAMGECPDRSGVVIPEESFGEGFWSRCKALERSFYVGVSWMEAARFFRRKQFLDAGGYDEGMVSGEDWDFSQRMEKEYGPLTRIDQWIQHNEGRISLNKTISKKYYYAKLFAHYTGKNASHPSTQAQTGLLQRYGLFFKKPKKLLQNPILGAGMLFMKTAEFGFGGVGYLIAKLRRPE